jgi:hypothetical protein
MRNEKISVLQQSDLRYVGEYGDIRRQRAQVGCLKVPPYAHDDPPVSSTKSLYDTSVKLWPFMEQRPK